MIVQCLLHAAGNISAGIDGAHYPNLSFSVHDDSLPLPATSRSTTVKGRERYPGLGRTDGEQGKMNDNGIVVMGSATCIES